jgi:AcrR family transcriptional regulator
MPSATVPKQEVLDRLTAAFRQFGYDGASLARLSKATGLGRSSLYHYFPNGKEDMAAAVLANAGARFDQSVLAPLRAAGAPSRERLARMTAGLDAFYAGGNAACLTDLFAIGDAGTLFRERIGSRIKAFIGLLAGVAVEIGIDRQTAEKRAEDALIAIQGALVLSRGLASPEPFRRVLSELPDRLLAPAGRAAAD